MNTSKVIEETQEMVDEMIDSQIESLINRKQELEEEINLFEEDYTGDLQEELDEINEKISALSKVDSFEVVSSMYDEDEDTAFLTNDKFEN